MCYWKILFLNKNEEGFNSHDEFQNRRKSIQYLVDYWNNIYPPYYKKMQKEYVEEQFITDNYSRYNIIFPAFQRVRGHVEAYNSIPSWL